MKHTTLRTSRGDFGARVLEPLDPGAHLAPVVCLHGFPDDASTFDAVAAELASAGHPVSAVYLRGYAPSTTQGPYGMGDLTEDLLAVAVEVGGGAPVHFLGYDYGAQIGYAALAAAPELFRSAVLLAGAHPAVLTRNTRRHPRQVWLSRYILFFQLGRFAEARVARDNYAALDRLWDRWSPDGIDPEHRATVKATIDRSMPAPIAMYRGGGFDASSDPITVPTLLVVGAEDGCSLPQMSDGQERYVAGPYSREVWAGVGHFPQLEHPHRTAGAALGWFGRHQAGG